MSADAVLLRCEPDDAAEFHCTALAEAFSEASVCNLPAGESPPPAENLDFAVVSGSTAGVYEDRPWIEEGRQFVRTLVDAEIPTLGVCFGHQLTNDALGGRVEQDEFRAGLVEAALADVPLFEGVSPVVPVIHGDMVRKTGDGLTPIASALTYEYPHFATRHERAPVWTIQFHPELGAKNRQALESFGWDDNGHSFADVTGDRLFENFRKLAE